MQKIAPYVSERRRRRRKVRLYLFSALAAFALYFAAFGALWFLLHAPLFRVDHVEVKGNDHIPAADVIALAQADPAGGIGWFGAMAGWGNMLAWPNALPARNLAMMPEVAGVSIAKDYFSHTVTIMVNERAPFAIWCFVPKGGSSDAAVSSSASSSSSAAAAVTAAAAAMANEQCYWFDSSGVLFEKSLSTQGNLIFVVNDSSQKDRGLGGTVLPSQFNANFLSVVDVLRGTKLGIREIDLRDLSLEEIDAATTEGPHFYFSLRFPADDYRGAIASLIAQPGFAKLQYVDCRTQDRIFYR